MNRNIFSLTLPALVTLLLVGGPVTSIAQSEEGDNLDTRIEDAATLELRQFEPTEAVDADLSVKDGIVTIEGSAESLPARALALESIAKIRGVRAVVDRLQIRESDRDDNQILYDVNRLFETHLVRGNDPIDSKVNDGVVTLTGEVSTYELHELAETMAESVVGVRGVTNLLRIQPMTPSDDGEILQHLELRLASDPWIDGDLVRADVEDGVVQLVGKVDTLSEKERLIDLCQVYGVTRINDEELEVDPSVRDPQERVHEPIYRPDEELEESVRQAFRQDPRIAASNPSVEVVDSEATLTGSVDSIGAKAAAEADASNTPGIVNVYSLLYILPESPVEDRKIEESLDAIYETDALLVGTDITPEVKEGVVTLNGEVSTKYQRRRAVKLAAFAIGVQRVESRLRVDWEMPEAYQKRVSAARTGG